MVEIPESKRTKIDWFVGALERWDANLIWDVRVGKFGGNKRGFEAVKMEYSDFWVRD
jgi:hypothetical protein